MVVAGSTSRGARTVVDVGGGHGMLLAGILAANPEVRGILFDQPHVVGGADAVLHGRASPSVVRSSAGTSLRRSPEGGDVYLLKYIVHDWDDAQAVAILRASPAGNAA